MDFESCIPQAHTECKEWSQKLLEFTPEPFPKTVDLTKIQQCNQRPDESILDYYERFEKTFKQHSGLTPESFSNHQNDPLLNSAFLEGFNEDLATLVKRHNLGCTALHANALVTLADQIFKTIKKEIKGNNYKSYEPLIAPSKYSMPVED